jgi:hypothetical protein
MKSTLSSQPFKLTKKSQKKLAPKTLSNFNQWSISFLQSKRTNSILFNLNSPKKLLFWSTGKNKLKHLKTKKLNSFSAWILCKPKRSSKSNKLKPNNHSWTCLVKGSLFWNRLLKNLRNKYKITEKYKNQDLNKFKFYGKNKKKSSNFTVWSMSWLKKTNCFKRSFDKKKTKN